MSLVSGLTRAFHLHQRTVTKRREEGSNESNKRNEQTRLILQHRIETRGIVDEVLGTVYYKATLFDWEPQQPHEKVVFESKLCNPTEMPS